MPLRIDDGISITPEAGAPPPPAVGPTSGPTLAPAAGPLPLTQPHELDIEPVAQRHGMWCWAACVEMVLTYYERREEQCAIVAEKLRLERPPGEGEPAPAVCANESNFGQEGCHKRLIDDVWRAFNIETRVESDGEPTGRVAFQKIKEEINLHQRPVEVALRWNSEIGGGGHVVLIKGWANVNGKDVVILNDPLASGRLVSGHEGRLAFDELRAAFGNGSWKHTWTDLKPE